MEKRKDSLSALKLCRFCLCQDQSLASLYDRSSTPKNGIPLTLKIHSCLTVEVFPSDKMPSFICNRCKFFMDIFFAYKQICRQADESILKYIQNGIELESIPWPSQLKKLFQNVGKPNKQVVKTVVEGGTTVQVMSQDASDSEDEEAHVFNVKLGGSEDSAEIKLLTSNKKVNDEKEPVNKVLESYHRDLAGTSSKASDGKPTYWACDQCYCTYPLQQLLELHKSRKHRERNVSCDQCESKFFSKYDLMTHILSRHSDEMPFQCVACSRKFKRLVLLKRHEKLMHADIPQLPCNNCPATFLSQEELGEHEKRHYRLSFGRHHTCFICDKKFQENATLQRHIQSMHRKKPTFRCEYCPERFSSATKLTSHVRSHASERAYPCRYCDKSFLKSHHYTRHLRVKHREAVRSARGPFGQSEQYRCDQCEDTFATQDELIYHSAIHATQNLTCPLCQEKFENVDAVTAHIKSHVNGIEFMCDLCELVFTSKEKLDSHVKAAHDDEINNTQEGAQDESSMEAEDEDDDENGINVKEEDDHMVVEIKKPDDFIITPVQADAAEKAENNNSEESEAETSYAELSTVETLAVLHKKVPNQSAKTPDKGGENQTASILRKAEEIKRKVQQGETEIKKPASKDKSNSKVETTDKSLRLLEKELQELKRTNTRNETPKVATKTVETRTRRPQIHTSTPKRVAEEKKSQTSTKSPVVEKKVPERRAVTKENKEPKETKETKTNNSVKEEKDVKEKDTPKNVVKNGGADKSIPDETIRRSTRPSKVKDYAKMIRDRSQDSDDDSDSDDEEYDGESRSLPKVRKSSMKPAPKPSPSPAAAFTPAPRKRGRPRKEPLKEVPNKIKKEEETEDKSSKAEPKEINSKDAAEKDNEKQKEAAGDNTDTNKSDNVSESKVPSGVLVSPTGQTLKKVPIRALPPGVKPMPLPASARPMGAGELCEMQIGKKVVKVQKIVMTKAEVEAMAKKGLVEMKDGTMVLKQGIKIPTSDPAALKSTLVGDKELFKESSPKKDKVQSQVEENS